MAEAFANHYGGDVLVATSSGVQPVQTIAPETVAMWESGRGLDHAALARIADRTDTTVEWLIAGFTPERLEVIRARAVGSLAPVPSANGARRPNVAGSFASPAV